MLLTIQIVNYNSRENLAKCLGSIREGISKESNFQIIVVNNESEAMGGIFGNLENVEVIEAGKNLGFSRAHNLGAKQARGKYILFLNPDTEVLPKALQKLVEALESDGKIGIAGPLLVGASGQPEEEHCGFQKSPLSLIGSKLRQSRNPAAASGEKEVDWISGGAMMIRKDLFEDLGGFDESYFMYFEDVDLCFRTKKKGRKIVVLPESKVIHKSGQSFSDSREKKRYYYNSQDYYIKKNFGLLWAWFVKILRFPYYVKNVWLSR